MKRPRNIARKLIVDRAVALYADYPALDFSIDIPLVDAMVQELARIPDSLWDALPLEVQLWANRINRHCDVMDAALKGEEPTC